MNQMKLKNIDRNDQKYKTDKCIYGFQQFQAIRSFGDSIVNGRITISEANEKQSNLLENILQFNYKVKSK